MNSARKFLALALAACHSKQYEEAGVFLVECSKCEGSKELAEELGADIALAEVAESSDAEDTSVADAGLDAGNTNTEDDELVWDDDGEPDEEESVSSGVRRKSTSMFRIGKIMAASMSVSSDDGDTEEDDTDEYEDDSESDPDFTGEVLVPASFSSVKVKSSTDNS